MKGFFVLLFFLTLSFCQLSAQGNHQEVNNSQNVYQVIHNGNVINYNIDTAFPELKKYIGQKIDLTGKSTTEQLNLLRAQFLPYLKDVTNSYEKVLRLLKELEKKAELTQQQNSEMLKLEASKSILIEQIYALNNRTESSINEVLHRTQFANEGISEIIELVKKIYYNQNEAKRKKEAREKIQISKYDSLRTGKRVKYMEIEFGTELSFMQIRKNGVPVNFSPMGGVKIGFNYTNKFRLRSIYNPLLIGSFSYSKAQNNREQIQYAALNVGITNSTCFSTKNSPKYIHSWYFPVGASLVVPVYHQYKSYISNLDNYALDKNNSNNELKRLNPVHFKISAGFKYVWTGTKNNLGISLLGNYCVTDFYRQSYKDAYGNMPFKNVRSNNYHVTLSLHYYIL